ncbi:MAG: LamG domain-containing protein, partial [Planctomycetes bacterium]|nr:LamG domain-containing protein [Planctomycetota bacterium]
MDTGVARTGRLTARFHPFVFIACTALALAGSQGVSADTGGPDAAGYRFIDSNEAGGPAYDFEDISGTGTRIDTLSDDNVVGPFPLGFTFEYYGTDYTQIYVSSNCFLTVLAGQDDGCCSSEPIPDASNPNGIIAGWYEDVDPRVGDVYYQTLGTAPNRRFIVQWSAVKLYGFPDTITLEYKLFERDDSIEVHYQQAVTAGQVYAAGIENQDGTVGLQYYRGSGDLDTPLAVKYYLNPVVLSIARADPDPTNASSADYAVTFTEDVTGVDVSDFALTTTGLSGTSVSSVMPDSASVYTVTVNTGAGDGTLRLDLDDDDSITSTATGDPLGGTGNDNGDFTGETYTIDRTGPQADAINRLDANPTDVAQVDFIVKFDEPVDGVGTDDFSTSTTGSLAGTSVDSVSPGFGNALDLSNNPEVGGRHLNLGNDVSLQVSALTLEAWIYYQKDGAETIVARGDGSGGTTDYIFQINKDGAGKLNLWAAGAWHSSTAAISPNTWTHVAVTYDGSDKKFYIGGALDNTAPHSGSVAQSAMNAYIGRQGQNADTGHYDGWVDEVRVWNVVREQAEIQATMSSTLMGGETGLVGYWRFEQFQDLGAGAAGVNDIEDCSANSNHGDAVNSPSLTTSNFSGLAPDYIVRVNTGTGSGELGLRLEDDDSITDEATNPFGGAGEQDYTGGQTYTIVEPPTVTTTAVTNVTATTASSGGNVTADGGEAVTARGVCWSTSANPTTADSTTTDGTGIGVFTSSITGLSANTTSHVRAYAINSVGTAYG